MRPTDPLDYQLARERIAQAPVSFLGRCVQRYVPFRRKVVRSNIDQVFGAHLTPHEKIKLEQAFYSHLITCIKEIILLRFMSNTALKNKVKVQGHEHVLNAASGGQGVLLLTAHLGNWELAPLGAMLNFEAFTGHFHFIRRTLKNKTIERMMFNRYHQAGLRIIPKQLGSLNKIFDALDEGHAVVFVLDQHAYLSSRDGIAVEFFGRQAGTFRSLASVACHTQLPVIPTSTYRQPDGMHVLEFHEPIPWQDAPETKASLLKNTRTYNQALEHMILAHPEQWMWVHKRWKLC